MQPDDYKQDGFHMNVVLVTNLLSSYHPTCAAAPVVVLRAVVHQLLVVPIIRSHGRSDDLWAARHHGIG